MTCPTCGGTCFVQFDLLDADWCPTCDGSGRVAEQPKVIDHGPGGGQRAHHDLPAKP